MSSQPYEISDEPKKNYLNSLNWMLTEIDKLIYMYKVPILQTLEPMQGIIDFLPEESKNNLQDVYKEIEKYLKNVKLIHNRSQIKKLYRKISSYVLSTHLQEVGVKPRVSSSPALGEEQDEETSSH